MVELDDIPEGQICHDKNGTEIKVGDTVKIRDEHLGTDREFTVAYIVYEGSRDALPMGKALLSPIVSLWQHSLF